jgi:hypothetical protein
METTNVEAVRSMTHKELVTAVLDLTKRIEALESAKPSANAAKVDMTDDHARRVLNGDLKDKSHKDAAAALGLSYGQVYSCRFGFTFKNVHKELADAGWKTPFVTKK